MADTLAQSNRIWMTLIANCHVKWTKITLSRINKHLNVLKFAPCYSHSLCPWVCSLLAGFASFPSGKPRIKPASAFSFILALVPVAKFLVKAVSFSPEPSTTKTFSQNLSTPSPSTSNSSTTSLYPSPLSSFDLWSPVAIMTDAAPVKQSVMGV